MFGSFRARLALLTLLGLAVRVLWVALEPSTSPQADETMWLTWGTEVLPSPAVAFSPLQLRFIFHPPLYLYFLGVPFALTGSLEAVKYVQSLVGALLVPALGLVGRRSFGERTGLRRGAARGALPGARLVRRALLGRDAVHGAAVVGDRATGRERRAAGSTRARPSAPACSWGSRS